MKQTIKIYAVTLLVFGAMLTLGCAARLSQADALKSVQAYSNLK